MNLCMNKYNFYVVEYSDFSKDHIQSEEETPKNVIIN